MTTPQNLKIQQLMNEVESLDPADQDLEAKLQQIAEAVAAEQRKKQPEATRTVADGPADPQDAFMCEGCQ